MGLRTFCISILFLLITDHLLDNKIDELIDKIERITNHFRRVIPGDVRRCDALAPSYIYSTNHYLFHCL